MSNTFEGDPQGAPVASAATPVVSGLCAIHVDQPAGVICARCGNYMCRTCSHEGASRFCPPCRERVGAHGFPFDRTTYSVGAVLEHSWTTLKTHAMPLLLGSLVLFGVSVIFGVLSQVLQVGFATRPMALVGVSLSVSFVQNLIQGVLQLGFLRMCYGALTGGTVEVAQLFSQVGKILKWIAQILVVIGILLPFMLLIGIPIGVGIALDEPWVAIGGAAGVGLLVAFPMVYVGLGFTFAQYELVYDDDCGPIEGLRRSWQIVRGQRLTLFGLTILGVLVIIGGLLLCCVGLVPAQAIFFLMLTTAHLALRNGSGLEAPRRSGS